ncbi:electron transfer flavoprotein subunit beta [Methylobacterium indicum]|uniref:electron transfer flavoprotein subunit beta n=1 Tax=Methylobacterium indicum TaxID=1775910 RepID=UPI000733EE5E|nr:electron transfer flavoprotein subunit beta [Methylobacterium indicum]KTS25626.1 electron transfer flavoprotein subunit beta [Methylobacterium indicum]KTS41452.1 electron transfer flavoprotein subunit beta [Methylobacterium indicum]KTS51805.1 electron transfer flavoprotein subunit beta [Methylobacterium indicum]
MRIAVLLSAGRHPVSGAPVLPRLEAQAIRLAVGLGAAGEVVGLHAGPEAAAVADGLGQGLTRIEHLPVPAEADPVPALAARLAVLQPDLILAGRRGQGGPETGLIPYALAEALDLPLIPDVVGLAPEATGGLSLDQSLGRGARRRVVIAGPVLATVHPDAPAPLAYAYGRARRGALEPVAVAPVAVADPAPIDAVEERPYRRRPKLVKGAPAGGSAAERLKAATGESGASSGGRLLVAPDPDEAAREILAYLRQVGVLAAPRATDDSR